MRYENRTFENETVTLDENEFVGCTIKNCTVRFGGEGFSMHDTDFDAIKLEFFGVAANTLVLLQKFMAADGDGTIRKTIMDSLAPTN